ncbi:MAG: hypothetical protein ACRD1Z_17810 [Vicinamibacteria bacterium]
MKPQPVRAAGISMVEKETSERSRPVDGIVVGVDAMESKRHPRAWVRDTWIVAASPEEGLAEFFLEDFDEPAGPPGGTSAWVCRAVRADGSIILGEVNFRDDRFLSEIFSPDGDE